MRTSKPYLIWIPEIINLVITLWYLIKLSIFNSQLKNINEKNIVIRSFEILAQKGNEAYRFLWLAFLLSLIQIGGFVICFYVYKQSSLKIIHILLILIINGILLIAIVIEIANPILIAFVITTLIAGGIGMAMS